MAKGSIYAVQQGFNGPIKFGFTQGDPHKRLRQLNTSSPYPIQFLAAIEATRGAEWLLHQRLAAARMNGEWFAPTAEVISTVMTMRCPEADDEQKLKACLAP